MESAMGFKTFCLLEAQKAGYDVVLWMDVSNIAIRPLDPIFEIIEKQGYMINANQNQIWGEWCSDEVLEYIGISRENSFAIPEVDTSSLGIKFSHPVGAKFFQKWNEWAAEGFVFRGTREPVSINEEFEAVKWNINARVSKHPRVKGHRHDQTAAGILAHQLGMNISSGIVTNKYAQAYDNPNTVFLLERSTSVTLEQALRRVFITERLRSPGRKLKKWLRFKRR